jgi:hypothetical protein
LVRRHASNRRGPTLVRPARAHRRDAVVAPFRPARPAAFRTADDGQPPRRARPPPPDWVRRRLHGSVPRPHLPRHRPFRPPAGSNLHVRLGQSTQDRRRAPQARNAGRRHHASSSLRATPPAAPDGLVAGATRASAPPVRRARRHTEVLLSDSILYFRFIRFGQNANRGIDTSAASPHTGGDGTAPRRWVVLQL